MQLTSRLEWDTFLNQFRDKMVQTHVSRNRSRNVPTSILRYSGVWGVKGCVGFIILEYRRTVFSGIAGLSYKEVKEEVKDEEMEECCSVLCAALSSRCVCCVRLTL